MTSTLGCRAVSTERARSRVPARDALRGGVRRDDGRDERPPLESLLNDPHHAAYVEGWGRPGDTAVIALDRSDEPVGAAGPGTSATAPGYGFLSEVIPELAIGVFAEFRGQGVGSLLLGSLIAGSAAGEPALSLSVEPDNPSRQLYVKHGFVVVPSTGESTPVNRRRRGRGNDGAARR